jgi:hypothetical protein
MTDRSPVLTGIQALLRQFERFDYEARDVVHLRLVFFAVAMIGRVAESFGRCAEARNRQEGNLLGGPKSKDGVRSLRFEPGAYSGGRFVCGRFVCGRFVVSRAGEA